MKTIRSLITYAILIPILVSAASAQAARQRPSKDPGVAPAKGAVKVEVVNDNTSDVVVYAIAGGTSTRLGMVTAKTTQTLTLSPQIASRSDVRILVDPIGGFGAYFSDPLLVSPDHEIRVTVAPVLDMSNVAEFPT